MNEQVIQKLAIKIAQLEVDNTLLTVQLEQTQKENNELKEIIDNSNAE
ncbi:hypothetical protein IRY55_02605 [Savagea sp. SN6]|uniref:Uncharacterized protein n=1 Tax=Savagea serpentis TaxID=2785297 RepID=A0A8J7KBB6_9BACL|nr:hypothetical protein [Savagea serpentis]MBF4500242.1 hypothetical protein [Savagea serpentis]